MTDREKELRELAQRAEDKRCGGYWPDDLRRLHGALWPKDVLALLDRIEALEKWQDDAVRLYEKGDRYVADHVWAERHRREQEET